MAQLIVIDRASKQEVGRRAMAPQERYQLYRDCSEHTLLTFNAKRYAVHTVAWQVPAEHCVVSVTYHSNDVFGCGCAVGCCGCC